jgi:hypothetical protein
MLTERFEMRFSPELIDKIDQWRETQPVPPSRAAAIRYLIETGLEMKAAAPSGSSGPGGAKKPRSTGKSASKGQ